MVRPPCIDSSTGMKKGAWSEDEDNKLKAYIERYGHWNWRLLPKYAGLKRCGKSCRLRWVNYLKPGVKRGNFTKEEQELVIKLHLQLGNKWSAIAQKLPGRTDNEIKNFWHTRVERRRRPNPSLKKPTTKPPSPTPTPTNNLIKATDRSSSEPTSLSTPSLSTDSQDQLEFMLSQILEADAQNNTESFAPFLEELEFDYPELRYTELSCSGSGSGSGSESESSYVNKWTVDGDVCGSFWNESSSETTSSYTTPLEEEGLLYYDPLLQYLDYDTNLF